MVAQVTGLNPGDFVHSFGDAHLYLDHLEQVDEQLSHDHYPLPEVKLNPERRGIDDFVFEDLKLRGYEEHPGIRAPIAI